MAYISGFFKKTVLQENGPFVEQQELLFLVKQTGITLFLKKYIKTFYIPLRKLLLIDL